MVCVCEAFRPPLYISFNTLNSLQSKIYYPQGQTMQASLSRGKQLPKSQSSRTRRFKRDRPAPETLGVFPLPHPELADSECFSLFWKLARQEGLACALWRGPASRQTQEGPQAGGLVGGSRGVWAQWGQELLPGPGDHGGSVRAVALSVL